MSATGDLWRAFPGSLGIRPQWFIPLEPGKQVATITGLFFDEEPAAGPSEWQGFMVVVTGAAA